MVTDMWGTQSAVAGRGVARADESSVAAATARWRAAFVTAFVLFGVIKLIIAMRLSPFGDEAFYWQESRRLAWGYSDLPPLTACLIRLGETLAGHGLLGMRWPFLLLGSVLPWLLVNFTRLLFDARAGWQAGLVWLCLPLGGSLGVLALPDVPLTFAVMLALYAFPQALMDDRWRHWLLLGAALAMAWATHYRAAMLMLAGTLMLIGAPSARGQWHRPRLWIALGVAALGLVPLLISNWQQAGAGLIFQLVDRHPWRFHADALVQPLEQALTCTPLQYGLLLWALWCCWRRRGEGAPWDWLALCAGTFLLGYLLLGLFADDLRFRAHWPLPGYLPLMAALPVLLRQRAEMRGGWRRVLLICSFALAGLGQLTGLGYLTLAASGRDAGLLAGAKAFPTLFVGWRESAQVSEALLAVDQPQPTPVLVADNFMLAAELDFQLNGRVPVFALDSPLNHVHGRAPQLALWRLDEAGLRSLHAGRPMLLVVDETALRERQRLDWLGSLCSRIVDAQPAQRLDLFAGRRRFAFYRGLVPGNAAFETPPSAGAECLIWQRAHAAQYGAPGDSLHR
jgi:4-amino-4-deoxy-L-arabinose transferase-like glycosyltransferase